MSCAGSGVAADEAPRVLLLDGGVPARQTAGGVLLRDLVRFFEPGTVAWFGLRGPADPPTIEANLPAGMEWLPLDLGTLPGDSTVRFTRRIARRWPWADALRRLASSGHEGYGRLVARRRLARRAAAFGRRHAVDAVLAVMNDPMVVYMARDVASRLGVPLLLNVQDPPERFALDAGFDATATSALLDDFERAMKAAAGVTTASDGMRDAYRSRFGIDSTVLIHGLDRSMWKLPRPRSGNGDFVIGFAGNLYANQEWDALVRALASVNWSIGGRNVVIWVLAPHPIEAADLKAHVHCLGWLPVDQAVQALSETDLTYLPYWFDSDRKLFVEQCFPNKLSTYLAAGRPVLYHGPSYASVSGFLRRFAAGYQCHSLEPAPIIAALAGALSDAGAFDVAVRGGRQALEEELNREVFGARAKALVRGGVK